MAPHRGRLLASFALFFVATSGLASSMKIFDEIAQINVRTVTLKLSKGSLNYLDLSLQSIIETTSKSKGAREDISLKKYSPCQNPVNLRDLRQSPSNTAGSKGGMAKMSCQFRSTSFG